MKLHQLHSPKGARKTSKRIGRGTGSGRGTYSGRGIKGQRARTGGKKGLALKGLRKTFKRIPKLRGFKSLREKTCALTLGQIDHSFQEGDLVNLSSLYRKGLVAKSVSKVKLIQKGQLTKKLQVQVDAVSSGAKKLIEEKGGEVISTQ